MNYPPIERKPDGSLYRMTPAQHRAACALVGELCCNHKGGCLYLGCGECPQMLTRSLVCRHFRHALLEDKEGKALKAAILKEDHAKKCEVCGQHFRAVGNRAKYCARCSKRMERERKSEWARKSRKRVDV